MLSLPTVRCRVGLPGRVRIGGTQGIFYYTVLAVHGMLAKLQLVAWLFGVASRMHDRRRDGIDRK